jgi:hypothetical protein
MIFFQSSEPQNWFSYLRQLIFSRKFVVFLKGKHQLWFTLKFNWTVIEFQLSSEATFSVSGQRFFAFLVKVARFVQYIKIGKNTKRQQNVPNCHKKYQLNTKTFLHWSWKFQQKTWNMYTKIFNPKVFQNIPKLGCLVKKYMYHLAAMFLGRIYLLSNRTST